jgi:hypothetical protein
MSHRSHRIVLCTLTAAAAFALVSPAQAGFIGTRFDPTFFDGVGTFFVPDSPSPCLGLSDGFHSVNPGSEGCSGVVLVNASVNVDDGGGTAHLSLPPPTPSATAVTGIVLDSESSSILVGVNTVLIPILADACTGDLCGFNWFLAWDSGLPEGESLDNAVFLFRQKCFEGTDCGPIEQFGDPATNVEFFLTPEPGSLALLIGALGVGWIVRRRRTAA